MDFVGTGPQLWPLKVAGGGGENPNLTQGSPTTFQFNDLPDRAPTGPLAYYLVCLLLTIQGSFVQSGGTGNVIARDRLVQCLVDSIDWTNAWFGTPLSKQNNAGTFWPVIEFVAGGFKYGQPQANQIAAADGAHPFSVTLAIPAANDRRGRLVRDTSSLALLFQPSQLKLNVAPNSVAVGFSPGATITGLNARLSAVLVPRQEIVLATPMEWVLHQTAVAGNAVLIPGFGRASGFTGIEAKGGVAFLGELTSLDNQGGSFLANNVSNIQFQWRGQVLLQDIVGWVSAMFGGLPNDRPQQTPESNQGTAGTINDYAGFPRLDDTLAAGSLTIDLNNLRFFPWVLGGNGCGLAELQTADSDQTYYKTTSGETGTHLILAEYAKQWQEPKKAAFVALCKQGGPNSLANCVYPGRGDALQLRPRYPRDKHTITPDQGTYLPFQLI